MSQKQLNPLSIKIVCFDIWGTLFKQNEKFHKERILLFHKVLNKSTKISLEGVSTAFNNMKEQTESLSELKGVHIDWDERIRYMLSLLDLPVSDNKEILRLNETYQNLALSNPPSLMSSEILILLNDIQMSGRQIAIISNVGLVDSNTVKKMLAKHKIDKHITHQIFSDTTNLAKPNKLIFERLTNVASCRPEEVLHIGDSYQADYIGARKSGIYAINSCLDSEGIAKIREILDLRDTPQGITNSDVRRAN